MSIKAIETDYNGYRFRSRLEARWAVFFDALGLKWRYEVEGLEVHGIRYLPDFWIEDFNVYAETKPPQKPTAPLGLEKPQMMARAGLDILVLCGDPWPWEYVIHLSHERLTKDLLPFPSAQFSTCSKCHKPSLIVSSLDGSFYFTGLLHGCECDVVQCWNSPGRSPIRDGDRLDRAYIAARSARFEHGENPAYR